MSLFLDVCMSRWCDVVVRSRGGICWPLVLCLMLKGSGMRSVGRMGGIPLGWQGSGGGVGFVRNRLLSRDQERARGSGIASISAAARL